MGQPSARHAPDNIARAHSDQRLSICIARRSLAKCRDYSIASSSLPPQLSRMIHAVLRVFVTRGVLREPSSAGEEARPQQDFCIFPVDRLIGARSRELVRSAGCRAEHANRRSLEIADCHRFSICVHDARTLLNCVRRTRCRRRDDLRQFRSLLTAACHGRVLLRGTPVAVG